MSLNIKNEDGTLQNLVKNPFYLGGNGGVQIVNSAEEYQKLKENSVFIYKGETATIDGQLLNTGSMYLKSKGNFETVTNNTVVLPLEKPKNLLPGSMWLVRG